MRPRLSILQFLQFTIPGSLVPLYSVRLEELGFSPMVIALCCATQAVAGVVSSLCAGHLADRWFSANRVLTVCATLAGLDLLLLAELSDPLSVFLATLFFWLVAGPMVLLGTTISFAHLSRPDREFGPVRMWGTVGWMMIGWATGYWLSQPEWGSWLLEWFREDASPQLSDAFRIGAGFAFVLALYSLTLPATPPRRTGRAFAPLEAVKLLRIGPFAAYCVCVLGVCVTFPFSTQSTPLLLKDLGIQSHMLGPVLSVGQTTEIVMLGMLPLLMARLSVRCLMLVGLGAWLVVMCVMAIGGPVELVVASLSLNGLYITGFLVAGQVYVNGLATGDLRASVQGLLSCINATGTLVGNLLAGWLRNLTEGALPPTFVVAAVIVLLMLALFVVRFRPEERPGVA